MAIKAKQFFKECFLKTRLKQAEDSSSILKQAQAVKCFKLQIHESAV